MPTTHSRSLGQFFTPPGVVDFTLGALAWLDAASTATSRRLIDPACGEGAFVLRALEAGLVRPPNAYGLDTDPGLQEVWRAQGALSGARLGVADGLLADEVCGEPLLRESFDWVVGNPPYAGTGLKEASQQLLAAVADRYDLWRHRFGRDRLTWDNLRRVPIEILFIERFWQLCREGGHIAVILPEGVFSNSRWRFVRDWLLSVATVQAVVGLPRNTFRTGSTTAKTCLLLATRRPPVAGHRVRLAEVDSVGVGADQDRLPQLLAAWKEGRDHHPARHPGEDVDRW